MAAQTAEIIDLPTSAGAQRTEQAILNLFAAHKSVYACASAAEDDERLWSLVTEIENQIARYRATTAAALAVKVILAHDYMPHVPIRVSLEADIKSLIGENMQ